MKEYKILKSFRGSQTGATVTDFKANTIDYLSDDLAATAIAEGWVEELKPAKESAKEPAKEPTKEPEPKKDSKKSKKSKTV